MCRLLKGHQPRKGAAMRTDLLKGMQSIAEAQAQDQPEEPTGVGTGNEELTHGLAEPKNHGGSVGGGDGGGKGRKNS